MGWWKADPDPEPSPPPTQIPSKPQFHPPTQSSEASSCPVDEKTRSIWLKQAQSNSPPPPTQPIPSSRECSSDRISRSPDHPVPSHKPSRSLSHDRVVSSIPRAPPSASSATPSSIPANAEAETGTSSSGNWIYPSESQFYSAVMSKGTASSPDALLSSISHIIPIHNAVNERAWSLIKTWEGKSSSKCGGPKLHSFSGRGAGALTPKAKWNSWVLGYQEPFDRHDWVVERCGGEKVEYVIDFYQGKQEEGQRLDGKLNFYLDVRPKLNSLEGWRMRGERMLGYR